METDQVIEIERIRGAFCDIIDGLIVKRCKHDLMYEGNDFSSLFLQMLEIHGFNKTTVKDVAVVQGEKAPAFFIEGTEVFFGWVFWEQFTSGRLRKLFGSVVKNQKGDWVIQIPPSRNTIIYVNERHKVDMDINFPPEF